MNTNSIFETVILNKAINRKDLPKGCKVKMEASLFSRSYDIIFKMGRYVELRFSTKGYGADAGKLVYQIQYYKLGVDEQKVIRKVEDIDRAFDELVETYEEREKKD